MIGTVLIPVIIIHWYTYGQGLLLTDDSYHYLSASENFRKSFTLIDNNNHYLLFWPPLFPVFISIFSVPEQLFSWINLVLLIFISISIFRITTRVIQSTTIAFVCFFYIITGVHLLLISSFLWTELLFLFFTSIFLENLLKPQINKNAIYVAIIMGILMCLQRNAGIFIAVGATIWMLLKDENAISILIKPIHFFLYVISGSLIWNFYVWFYLPRDHFNFTEELFQHALYNFNSMSCAIVSAFLPIKYFGIPILFAGLVLVIYLMRKELAHNRFLQLLFIVSLSYLFFLSLVLVVNIAGFRVDFGEGDRFIAVILPLLSIIVFKSFELFLNGKNKLARKISFILIAIWLIYPLSRTLKNSKQWHGIERVGGILIDIEYRKQNVFYNKQMALKKAIYQPFYVINKTNKPIRVDI